MARDGVVGDLRRGRIRARPATTTGSDPAGLFLDVQRRAAQIDLPAMAVDALTADRRRQCRERM